MLQFFGKNKSGITKLTFVVLSLSSAVFLFLSVFKPIIQDEGVFLTIGKYLGSGLLPYRDFFDHKNSGIYILGFFISLISKNPLCLRLIMIGLNILIAALIYIYLDSKKQQIGHWAALTYLFSTIFYQGNFFLTEIPLIIFLLLSLIFLQRKQIFLSGTMIAIAFLFKQTALINFLILFFYLLYYSRAEILRYLYGFFIPIICYIIILFSLNLEREAFLQTIFYNITSYPPESFGKILIYFYGGLKRTFWIWLALPWALYQKKLRFDIVTLFALVPLFFLLNRSYLHYWLQVLPFICILFGIMVQSLKNKRQQELYFLVILFSAGLNLRFSLITFINDDYSQFLEQKEAIATINKMPGNLLLAENQHAGFYFLTNKKPLSRYLYVTEINTYTENSETKVLEEIERNNEVTILWTTGKWPVYAKKINEVVKKENKIEQFKKIDLIIYKN